MPLSWFLKSTSPGGGTVEHQLFFSSYHSCRTDSTAPVAYHFLVLFIDVSDVCLPLQVLKIGSAHKHEGLHGWHRTVRWPVVIQSCDRQFLGDRIISGVFEAVGDFTKLQGSLNIFLKIRASLSAQALR